MDNRSFLRRLPGKIITPINIKTGRAIYKNGANFTDNFTGNSRLQKARKMFKQSSNDNIPSSIEDNNTIQQLNKLAAARYDKGFEKSIINSIIEEYKKVINDPQHSCFVDELGRRGRDKGHDIYLYDLFNPASSVPSIRKIFTEEFKNFLRLYFQSEFRIEWVNMRRTIHIPQSKLEENYPHQPYSLKWHFDGHSTDTLKFFINLSDVTENDGPLHFLDKERSFQICKQGYFNRFNYGVGQDVIEDKRYLHKLTGETGSSAFCNTTLCLHRAGVPAKGHTRDILEFNFSPAEKEFCINDLDSYSPPVSPYA